MRLPCDSDNVDDERPARRKRPERDYANEPDAVPIALRCLKCYGQGCPACKGTGLRFPTVRSTKL